MATQNAIAASSIGLSSAGVVQDVEAIIWQQGALTQFNLDMLQTSIENTIKAAFPVFQTVSFYDETRTNVPKPACLLEISEWQHFDSPDPGTEQQPVMARFEARIVIDGIHTNASKRLVRQLAASLSAFLYMRRWPDQTRPGKTIPTGPAEFLGAYHDQFHPELDQYQVWRVEWQHILHFGTSAWQPDGSILPTIVMVASSINGGPLGTPTQIAP